MNTQPADRIAELQPDRWAAEKIATGADISQREAILEFVVSPPSGSLGSPQGSNHAYGILGIRSLNPLSSN
ncbi:MAG: hypothetical protein L7V86_03940 [Verrucomicrobiales bacterium]|nr:hypothetical protein [Verrucomicrobiales bacterium]